MVSSQMCRFPRPNALMNPMQLWLLEFELRADNNPNALMDSSDTPQDSLCLSPMLNELRPRESSCASASALHTASSLCSHCFWKCSLPHAVSTTESGLFSDLYRYKVFLVALRNLSPTFVATVPIFFATCW